MKKTLLLLAAMCVSLAGFADLSTGEPHATVIPRTGNRPVEGDWGMYLGASVTQIMDMVAYNKSYSGNEKGQVYWALPMINLKYYFTDRVEGRLGFQFASYGEQNELSKGSNKVVQSERVHYTRFLPGFAYHFSMNNPIDVYLGAQIPVGFNVNDNLTKADKNNYTTSRDNMFVIGAGVFLGMQFFVADLPFAIGIEGGYSGQAHFSAGARTTNVTEGNKQTNVTVNGASTGFDTNVGGHHIDANWGADAAITFTYFFRN